MRRSEVGHTRDAGWQIGVSRTIDQPAEALWSFLTSQAGIAIWLGEDCTLDQRPGGGYETAAGVRGETRSFHELDRVRLTWQPADWTHDTTLQLVVRSAGDGRARLTVHQERLANTEERERQRRHWQGVVNAIVEALTDHPMP